MNFAIIGASGNVGRKTIEILEKSKISFKELYLIASKKSEGKKVKFREKEIEIESLENEKCSEGVDKRQSGKYLILHLCHFFDTTKSVTSLTLVRDTYGLHTSKK